MLIHLSSIQRNVLLMLMLILSYLLAGSVGHRTAIQLTTIVADLRSADEAEEGLRESLRSLRMQAETGVVINTAGEPIPDILARESARAALVILGMAKPDESSVKTYLPALRHTTAGLDASLNFFPITFNPGSSKSTPLQNTNRIPGFCLLYPTVGFSSRNQTGWACHILFSACGRLRSISLARRSHTSL